MLRRWQFLVLTGLGAAASVLVIANVLLLHSNRQDQAALLQRQHYVQQTVALESLYNELVKALAEAGAYDNDRQVLDLLAAQGLQVTVTPPAVPASATLRDGAAVRPGASSKR